QTGGLVAFILFILVISRSWSRIGTARSRVEGQEQESLMWLLGVALFANVVAFFGVNYFDQSKVSWFLLLAMISAVTAPILGEQVAAASTVSHASTGQPGASMPRARAFDTMPAPAAHSIWRRKQHTGSWWRQNGLSSSHQFPRRH